MTDDFKHAMTGAGTPIETVASFSRAVHESDVVGVERVIDQCHLPLDDALDVEDFLAEGGWGFVDDAGFIGPGVERVDLVRINEGGRQRRGTYSFVLHLVDDCWKIRSITKPPTNKERTHP
jgi:hypothetical protein